MRCHDAGFWLGVAALALLLGWGTWRLSAPPIHHPSILTDVGPR